MSKKSTFLFLLFAEEESKCLQQLLIFLLVHMQVTERKLELAKLEAIDCGKPLEEAAWDIVCIWEFKGTILCSHTNMYLRVHFWLLLGWCRRMLWVLCWSCWSFGSKAEESYFSSSGYNDMSCAEGTYWCSWFNYSMVLASFSSSLLLAYGRKFNFFFQCIEFKFI